MNDTRGNRNFFIVLLLLLFLLAVGVWQLQDFPGEGKSGMLQVPYRMGDWQGQDVSMEHHENEVLAPAQVVSRAYLPRPFAGMTPTGPKESPILPPGSLGKQWQIVWVNMIQTDTIGSLHNFYDSLVASGSRPRIVGTHVIQTAKGPLKASLIRYSNAQGHPFDMLLWYQWRGGNAPDRWHWYWNVIQVRLRHVTTPWQMVEVATPAVAGGENNRLERFARALYESTAIPITTEQHWHLQPGPLDKSIPTPDTAK